MDLLGSKQHWDSNSNVERRERCEPNDRKMW